jgi:hypothetical protein
MAAEPARGGMMISAQMIVKNEEDLCGWALEMIRPWVSEIIVVDTGSTDHTIQVAGRFADEVCSFPMGDSFSDARNFGLGKATRPWALVVDADEMFTMELMQWISRFVNDPTADRVRLMRHNLIDGEDIGQATFERHVRLFRSNLRYRGRIHEQVEDVGEIINAPDHLLIKHYKTGRRQARQNELYRGWK